MGQLDPELNEVQDAFTGGIPSFLNRIELIRKCVNAIVRWIKSNPQDNKVTIIVSDNGFPRYAQAPLNLGEFITS